MTAAEADQKAACNTLEVVRFIRSRPEDERLSEADQAAMKAAYGRIETWLRRRAVGGDKILTRQMERPTGRQVGMSPKKARKYGIPEK